MKIETIEKQEPFYVKEKDIHSENQLSDCSGVCTYCEEIRDLKDGLVDLVFTTKLSMENVAAKVCTSCGNPVSYSESTIKEIKEQITEFKKNRPSISTLLKSKGSDAYRWCESTACCCVGSSNCSGGLSSYMYTKKEWILWKSKTPERVDTFVFYIKDFKSKMELVNFLKDEFYVPSKEAYNVTKTRPLCFGIEYIEGTQEEINEDVEQFLLRSKEKGIVLEKDDIAGFPVFDGFYTFGRELD